MWPLCWPTSPLCWPVLQVVPWVIRKNKWQWAIGRGKQFVNKVISHFWRISTQFQAKKMFFFLLCSGKMRKFLVTSYQSETNIFILRTFQTPARRKYLSFVRNVLILNACNFQNKILSSLTCVLINLFIKCILEDGFKDSCVMKIL